MGTYDPFLSGVWINCLLYRKYRKQKRSYSNITLSTSGESVKKVWRELEDKTDNAFQADALLFCCRAARRDTSRFCEKNSGNSGTGIAHRPEKDEGSTEWLI
jgi:hypothetical protein